jgi:hypothetical protein
LTHHNAQTKPFPWTAKAENIMENIRRAKVTVHGQKWQKK